MKTTKSPLRLSTPLWRESIAENYQRRQDRAERIQRWLCLYVMLPAFITAMLWAFVKLAGI